MDAEKLTQILLFSSGLPENQRNAADECFLALASALDCDRCNGMGKIENEAKDVCRLCGTPLYMPCPKCAPIREAVRKWREETKS